MSSETLSPLEHHFIRSVEIIETWFSTQWAQYRPPIFASVDLRRAGFKWAPVDMNFFPAGFNNLPDYTTHFSQVISEVFSRWYPQVSKILIIPENHTRNSYYFESLGCIQSLLEQAGFSVRIGSLSLEQPMEVVLTSGEKLLLTPLAKAELLCLPDFIPDIVVLNNDLSEGLPKALEASTQVLLPPTCLGWFARSKARYFSHYSAVVTDFSQKIGVESWTIEPYFSVCDNVDFLSRAGIIELEQICEDLFSRIEEKYRQHKVKSAPFLIIKSDQGTYGMAVMTIRDPKEVRNLNRKKRTHMSASKGGNRVTRVLVQEGVPSIDQQLITEESLSVSEPVIYTAGHTVLGGFHRIHPHKNSEESLNAPGMQFKPWQFSEATFLCEQKKPTDPVLYGYSVIARLAVLAGAREQAQYE